MEVSAESHPASTAAQTDLSDRADDRPPSLDAVSSHLRQIGSHLSGLIPEGEDARRGADVREEPIKMKTHYHLLSIG
jgi:hypothetical protein